MSQPAVLNLVRYDTFADETALDYVPTAPVLGRRDEIELVDGNGVPAAIPVGQRYIDQDYLYNFANGNIGRNALSSLHQIELDVDYITNDVRRKLAQWKKERAKVFFSPGFGRNTLMAWRPIACDDTSFPDGETLTDLTGQEDMNVVNGANKLLWDEATGRNIMTGAEAAVDSAMILPTPAGAGQYLGKDEYNRAVPGSPESNTAGYGAGTAGWEVEGAAAGDITFTLITNGFGHSDCPHSLFVTTTLDSSRSRQMVMSDLWDPGSGDYQGYTFTGAGSMFVTIWLKGRIEDGLIVLQDGAGNNTDADISGFDNSAWTPITLSLYSADWSAGIPKIKIRLDAGIGTTSQSFFEVGATTVSSGDGDSGSYRMWAPGPATPAAWGDTNVFTTSMRTPGTGTIFHSMWVPEHFKNMPSALADDQYNKAYQYIGIWYWDNFRCHIFYDFVAETWKISIKKDSSTTLTASIGELTPGAVNTVAVTWGNLDMRAYLNGVLMNTWTYASNDYSPEVGNEVTGHSYFPGWNAWGSEMTLLLSHRLEDRIYTGDEIAYLHSAAADPGALGVIVPARGRLYEIDAIPSIPVPTDKGTRWLGKLMLRQASYNHNLADITSQEVI